jgi:hypothetical protein
MSDHISIEVARGYVELIRCPICAAVLVDEEGEKAHLQWHELLAHEVGHCNVGHSIEYRNKPKPVIRWEPYGPTDTIWGASDSTELAEGVLNVQRERPGLNPETHCLDSGIRLRYDADENTPFVDNAGTDSPETWPEIGIRLARQARLKRDNHCQDEMRRG